MSYCMSDMELDYEEQIEYFKSEIKRLKKKCNRLIRENRELKNEIPSQTPDFLTFGEFLASRD